MGCKVSKLGPGEDTTGLRPVRRRVEEILGGIGRRRITGRRDSIVSTTKLLVTPEDVEEEGLCRGEDENEAAVKGERKFEGREEKGKEDRDEKKEEEVERRNQEEEIKKEKREDGNNGEKEKGDRREKKGDVDGAVDDKNRRLTRYDDDDDDDDDDDLVGSPSFRIYFVDDSGKTDDQGKEEHAHLGSISGKYSIGSKDDRDLANEGSVARAARRPKGRRLRALATKPITYGLRSCYVTPDDRSSLSTSSAPKPTPPTSTH